MKELTPRHIGCFIVFISFFVNQEVQCPENNIIYKSKNMNKKFYCFHKGNAVQ